MPKLVSDFEQSLITPEEKVMVEIGPFRTSEVVLYAEKLARDGIASRDQVGVFGEAIEKITKEIRRIENARDFFLEPIVEAKRTVEKCRKAQAAMFDGPLAFYQKIKDAIAVPYGQFVLKCKLEDYKKAKEEREAAAKKVEENAKKEGNDFMADIVSAEVLAEPIKKAVTTVKTVSGSTSIRFIQRLRIVNAKLVPRDYCKPDEEKLLADYKSGYIQEVQGVEFYMEPVSVVR